jgi:glyoxylase-like metal-dependent hydrolase (beta-lactamase superfamily II)
MPEPLEIQKRGLALSKITQFSRRAFLVATALAGGAFGGSARANSPPVKDQVPGLYRYRLGDFELTALNDGVWQLPIDAAFVPNAPWPKVQQAMTDAFMPATDHLALPFTALLVNTGSKLILIDTGTGGQITPTAGLLASNLKAAGTKTDAIDAVVITHFHPDHINGLKTKDDALVFPNAEIFVPEPEWTFWTDEANLRAASDAVKGYFLNVHRIFGNLTKDVHRYRPGAELMPGIVAVFAPGHTPGHHAIALASGNQSMMVLSDTSTHPALFIRHPEWSVAFDLDAATAIKTRKRLLDQVAAERMLVAGYHFPFPACGHIAKTATGYEFYPAQWSPQL